MHEMQKTKAFDGAMEKRNARLARYPIARSARPSTQFVQVASRECTKGLAGML
jgi:hypothetical protein